VFPPLPCHGNSELLCHVLHFLQRAYLHLYGSRLRLEGGRFLGDRVDALARFLRRLVLGHDLEHARHGEVTCATFLLQVTLDHGCQLFKHRVDLLLAQLGSLGDVRDQAGLAQRLSERLVGLLCCGRLGGFGSRLLGSYLLGGCFFRSSFLGSRFLGSSFFLGSHAMSTPRVCVLLDVDPSGGLHWQRVV